MEQSLSKNNQWAFIAKDFPGRTQHHIKNRFICVMKKKLTLTNKKIRDLLKTNGMSSFIKNVLAGLNVQNLEKDKIEIEPLELNQSENNQNFSGFMGFQEESSFVDFYSEESNFFSEIFNNDEFIHSDERDLLFSINHN